VDNQIDEKRLNAATGLAERQSDGSEGHRRIDRSLDLVMMGHWLDTGQRSG